MPPRSVKRKKGNSGLAISSPLSAPQEVIPSSGSVVPINPFVSGLSQEERGFLDGIQDSRNNWGSPLVFPFLSERVREITHGEFLPDHTAAECVMYWMSRDCRVQDNWALVYAQRIALQTRVPLIVVFCLTPKFSDASLRAYKFLLGGLREVEHDCRSLSIEFRLLIGYAKDVLPQFMLQRKCTYLVCDFNPLREPLQWVDDVKVRIGNVSFVQVDAHNVVPCWITSDKEEIAARTIRSKVHKNIDQYHTAFPPVVRHPYSHGEASPSVDWQAAEDSLEVDRSVDSVDWALPGTTTGLLTLRSFLQSRLKNYEKRNDPNVAALSMLSPWFHFGQVSVARAILEGQQLVREKPKMKPGFEVFFEEAVVRRELSDNFCFYNKNYDSMGGAKPWARLSLQLHTRDPRPVVYSLRELEECRTHDDLWNASQMQMNREGKLHGFLRMYWAKKILEWTASPEDALKFCIHLNDKYNLDGRDCNGYVGCMWSVCGIHDMGWKERPIFGKIRYMNYEGCRRKFDVAGFVDKYRQYFPAPVAVDVSY